MVNEGGQGEDVHGLANDRRIEIKSDDGDDCDDGDVPRQVKGGGAEVAIRTASPGKNCSPEFFKASARILSRYLRCMPRPSFPL